MSAVIQQAAEASSIVRNQYIVFSDRADFEKYVQKTFPDSSASLLPATDARYARIEAILSRVWAGYQALFPQKTDQLPVPALAILQKDFFEAYVTDDPQSHLLPNAFFVYEKVLSRPDHEIAGLIAHELTHLLTPSFQFIYYQVLPGQPEPLGFQQVNDPQVEKIVTEWRKITEVVGPFLIPELNGLPAPIVYDGQLFNLIPKMAALWGDSKLAACQNIQNPLPSWRLKLVLRYLSMIDQVVRMTPDQAQEMDKETRSYIADMYSCLGRQQGQLLVILQELYHKPAIELAAKYGEIAKTFDQAPNVVDGIFAVTAEEYQKLQAFAAQYELSSFRAYSDEEIADDNAVRVMHLAGFPADSIADFFLTLMEDAQPGSRAQCALLLQFGQVPPYGLITDSHHAVCFRVYHVRQMAAWLEQRPAQSRRFDD